MQHNRTLALSAGLAIAGLAAITAVTSTPTAFGQTGPGWTQLFDGKRAVSRPIGIAGAQSPGPTRPLGVAQYEVRVAYATGVPAQGSRSAPCPRADVQQLGGSGRPDADVSGVRIIDVGARGRP